MRFINEMEEEGAAAAWESLDDDNDNDGALLQLRPCKRHQINLLSRNTSSSQPIVLSPSHSSTPPSLTLRSPHSQFQPAPPPSTSLRLIPGPAGAVKAAMLRRSRASYPNPRGAAGDDPPISTQEYIRRAAEDGDLDDDDFKSNPWLCALQFLGPQGMLDGGISSTPLSSIKKCLDIGRADQVVAVIKSCKQNGLGDLMVTLKDPTGTVDASIHHKVIAKFEFGKEISVGSVLILQKVAVFAPSQSACYLNITLNNVVKVISKDSGPPPKQNYLVSAIKRVAAGNECVGDINNMHEAFSFKLDRPEVFMDDTGQCSVRSSSALNDKPTEKENHPLPLGGHCGDGIANRRDQNEDLVIKEPRTTVRQDVAREILNKARRMADTIDDDADDVDKRKGLDDVNGLGKKGSNSLSNLQKDATPAENLVRNGNDQESRRIINGVQKQRQSMMSRASLPEWTDEQLNELFGDNSEDHDSLF